MVGAASATGTVTLSAAAPSGGGVSVLLSSSDNAAVVDPSVDVPAGARSRHVQGGHQKHGHHGDDSHHLRFAWRHNAKRITESQSAATAAARRHARFVHRQPGERTHGGSPSTGTVRLLAPAPSGGVLVSLGSNLPGSASVPPSVVVGAGATSASFTVTTFNVGATTVQLNALLGDVILFTAITVNPAESERDVVADRDGPER